MPIDPHSHVPIYDQIVQHLRGAVAAGVYRRGEMLPSTRALALELSVNPNTVQRAYQELEREGLVVARRGLGMFVATEGRRSAQQQATSSVKETFDRGIQTGRQANLGDERIRNIFDAALARSRPPAPSTKGTT